MGRIPARMPGAQPCRYLLRVSAQSFGKRSRAKVRRPRRLQRKGGHVEVQGTTCQRHLEDAWPGVLEAENKQDPDKWNRVWIRSIHGPRL